MLTKTIHHLNHSDYFSFSIHSVYPSKVLCIYVPFRSLPIYEVVHYKHQGGDPLTKPLPQRSSHNEPFDLPLQYLVTSSEELATQTSASRDIRTNPQQKEMASIHVAIYLKEYPADVAIDLSTSSGMVSHHDGAGNKGHTYITKGENNMLQ